MKIKLILSLSLVCLLCSCGSIRQASQAAAQSSIGKSKYSSSKVELGMSKEKVISLYGTPFKEAFKTTNFIRQDELYYKEAVGSRYILTIIFRFSDNKLIAQEQGKEEIIDLSSCHDCNE